MRFYHWALLVLLLFSTAALAQTMGIGQAIPDHLRFKGSGGVAPTASELIPAVM